MMGEIKILRNAVDAVEDLLREEQEKNRVAAETIMDLEARIEELEYELKERRGE